MPECKRQHVLFIVPGAALLGVGKTGRVNRRARLVAKAGEYIRKTPDIIGFKRRDNVNVGSSARDRRAE